MQFKPYRTVILAFVLLSASLVFVLDVIPWIWSSTWTKFKYCGHEQNLMLADTVCILFVAAEPRAPGVASSDISSVNPISRRFMANMFRAAHSFVTPDLIVFIGDFFDKEAWRSRQTEEYRSQSESSFLADFFVVPQDSQVVIVPGEALASPSASQRAAVAVSPATVSNRRMIVVDHPSKTKFLDVMVWPGDRQLEQLARSSTEESDAKLKRLKEYAADPPGSVQMMLSFRAPGAKRTPGLLSHLPSLKPHLLISQGDGQASLHICELASWDACHDESRDFADGHMLQQGLRSNRSLFINLQLPTIVTSASCCFSIRSAKVGFAAAHIDMFGDMSVQVLWSPTPIAIIFTYLLTAAISAFIVYRWARVRTSVAALLCMPALLFKRQAFTRLRQ